MSLENQLKLAKTKLGRIELHILSLLLSGKYMWHIKGILREIS